MAIKKSTAKVPEGFEKYCSGDTLELQGRTFFILDAGRKKKSKKTTVKTKKAPTPV